MPLLSRMVGFLTTTASDRATTFYADTLGFGFLVWFKDPDGNTLSISWHRSRP